MFSSSNICSHIKHKKLKAKYNDLYIEDEDLISRQNSTYEQQNPVYEVQEQAPVYEQEQEQTQPPIYQNIKRNNWRSMLSNR